MTTARRHHTLRNINFPVVLDIHDIIIDTGRVSRYPSSTVVMLKFTNFDPMRVLEVMKFSAIIFTTIAYHGFPSYTWITTITDHFMDKKNIR